MKKTILFLAANPLSTDSLRLGEEVREIDEGLRRSKMRDAFTLEQRWAVRPEDLRRSILDYQPQIVHFAGHGAGEDGLILESKQGVAKPVSGEALFGLFSLFPDIECVLLNACYSEIQAQTIGKCVPYVIGMTHSIGDEAAVVFATAFYDALGSGRNVEFSFAYARNAIELEGISQSHIPNIKINKLTQGHSSAVSNRHQQYDR